MKVFAVILFSAKIFRIGMANYWGKLIFADIKGR